MRRGDCDLRIVDLALFGDGEDAMTNSLFGVLEADPGAVSFARWNTSSIQRWTDGHGALSAVDGRYLSERASVARFGG